MVKLFCAIVGDAGSAFSVEVGEDQTVDDLKDAITEKNKEDPILKNVAAKNLKLFLAKKDGAWLKSKDLLRMRKGEIPNEVESRYMNEELEDPTDKISSKFPREIPDGTIHVLLVVSSEGVSGAEVWSMERSAKRPKVLVNLELDDVWKYMEMEMNALPVDHELPTILQRPLPFRLELCHSKGTESIFEPNGPLVMCEQLTVMINAFLVARDTRVDRVVSENAWQYFYDLLLSIPISLCWAHEFCVTSGRNVVDETGTTTRKKRPDFILHISGLLLLRGEEKSNSTGPNVSSAELTAKMRHWNPMFYGDLPYILGYASSGAQLRLVKIDRNLRAHTICEFQSIFRQAAEVIKTFYNLTFLLYQMHLLSKRINPSPLMPFTPVTNEKRTIELMDDVIKRTIKRDSVDFERLADVYSTLRDLNNRVHERTHLQTVRQLDLKRSLLCVQLSPLGNVRPPVDIDEVRDWLKGMLTALKYWHSCNYCHGDLRWSNIVHVPVSDSGFWVLIDMDESRKPNTTTIDWNHKFQGHKLTFEHDWYQLGQLMNSLSFPLPNDLVDIQKLLLSAVDTPTDDDLPTLLLHQLHY